MSHPQNYVIVDASYVIRAQHTDTGRPVAAVCIHYGPQDGAPASDPDYAHMAREDGMPGGGRNRSWLVTPNMLEPVHLEVHQRVSVLHADGDREAGTVARVDLTPDGDVYHVVLSDGSITKVPRLVLEMIHDDLTVTTESEQAARAEADIQLAEAIEDTTNPKDAVARLKVDLSLVSPVALAHIADALMDGAAKYGPYNWRDKQVQARVYVAAAMRHLNQWAMGEEVADDSGAHHLGHAAACLVILLDAQAHNCLVDNRAKGMTLQLVHDAINSRRAAGIAPTA